MEKIELLGTNQSPVITTIRTTCGSCQDGARQAYGEPDKMLEARVGERGPPGGSQTDEVNVPQTPADRQAQSNIAFPWWDSNCSVVPIRTDGTKRPTMPWQKLQTDRLSETEVIALWGDDSPLGVAVICGSISGNLEMLELEGDWTSADVLERIRWEMSPAVVSIWDDLLERGYVEWTPSGGLHLLYRLNCDVPGNTKIAQGPDGKTRSETRGEGGYVIVAPTAGACHPTGENWVAINGGPETIMEIGWAPRCEIHEAIKRAIDETPPPPPPRPVRTLATRVAGAVTPGDDFAARVDWAEILEPEGWTLFESRRQERLWTRPGKDRRDGASASTEYEGKPGFYVWSTSAGLPTEEPLSKLFVYAHYRHGGDLRGAVRELARQGYGTPLEPRLRSDTFMGTAEPSTEVALVGDVRVDSETTEPEHYKVPYMDDSSTAQFYLEHMPSHVSYVPERKKWMFYEDGIWQLDHDSVRIAEVCRDIARKISMDSQFVDDKTYRTWARNAPNAGRINAAISMMRTYVRTPVDRFDQDRNLINVQNGTLDLTSLELLPHDPAQHLTKKMGAAFDPNASATRWDKYLDEVLPDKKTQDFLQRMVGYSMLGYPAERALAVLHGPGGTGKSRFVEILSAVMGTYSSTAAASLFRSKHDGREGPTNDLNDLRGARVASVSELDSGVRMDEALVKRLTGLDRITSRGLYEENQTWTPQCVIWLATNHHFRVNSDDGAIWDRIKVIPFTQKIEKKDPYILDELMREASGILNWMIEGLAKYRERGLSSAPEVDLAVEAYKEEQDSVREFLKDSLADGVLQHVEHAFMQPKQLFAIYRQWCTDQMIPPLGRNRFHARMEALGFMRERPTGANNAWWRGLQLDPARGALGTL